MEDLKLHKVEAYELSAPKDDRNSEVKGYYKNGDVAHKNKYSIGYFGSDGSVERVEIYEDENGKLFSVEELGDWAEDKVTDEQAINKIKEKLTEREQKILGI